MLQLCCKIDAIDHPLPPSPSLSITMLLASAPLPLSSTPPYLMYAMLQLRQFVFIIEQTCLYGDLDGADGGDTLHLPVFSTVDAPTADEQALVGAGGFDPTLVKKTVRLAAGPAEVETTRAVLFRAGSVGLGDQVDPATIVRLVGTLRILAPKPGQKEAEAALGRVAVHAEARGLGVGRFLVERGIAAARQRFPGAALHAGAQLYLQAWYESLGFVRDSDVYLEDDIPHISMHYEEGVSSSPLSPSPSPSS